MWRFSLKKSIENIFLMSRYSKLVDYGKNKVQQLVTHWIHLFNLHSQLFMFFFYQSLLSAHEKIAFVCRYLSLWKGWTVQFIKGAVIHYYRSSLSSKNIRYQISTHPSIFFPVFLPGYLPMRTGSKFSQVQRCRILEVKYYLDNVQKPIPLIYGS